MNNTKNIHEELSIREEYFTLSQKLCNRILNDSTFSLFKNVIAVGGESGCGKSTTAFCLEKEFMKKGINCVTLHMDSYFKLPPQDNHQNRLKSLSNVGSHELDMDLLNSHIKAFKNDETHITVPIVSYIENKFEEKELDLESVEILIIEGVYSFLCNDLDKKIFLSRTYKETFKNRVKRTREEYDPHVELILEIEHKIVSPLKSESDFIISQDYNLA